MDQTARTAKQIGETLRRYRMQKNWSQDDIARATHLRQATISTLENGGMGTTLKTLTDILAALELELLIRPRKKSSIDDIGHMF